jgi:hypothetical protein
MKDKLQTSLLDELGIKTDTNRTTDAIITFLNYNGFCVWRQNNTGIYDESISAWRKSPNSMKGVSDIIGYNRRNGQFVAIEVKTGTDRLSESQKIFLDGVHNAGGFSMVAHSFDDFLTKYEKRAKK